MSLRDKLLRRFGIEEPYATTFRGWDEFHAKVKQEHPIAWFCIDTFPTKLTFYWRRITRPFTGLYDNIKYRTRNRYHIIHTGLKPGYADYDTRMIHGMFNMLVEFVEIDKAMMQELWNDSETRKNETVIQRLSRRFKRKRYRPNPQFGLKYLKWEMSLDGSSPHQAEAAREIWQLYHWWKHVKPTRPDPMDASGWSEYCQSLEEKNKSILDTEDMTREEVAHSRECLDRLHEIEANYDAEDEDYLIRLIKIRKSLWT